MQAIDPRTIRTGSFWLSITDDDAFEFDSEYNGPAGKNAEVKLQGIFKR
ncbi:MAG TPA: hypothetical protein VK616_09750 [Flavitalea sp.]|nr:hypothetical protein [Flavitalea sp.]